MYNFIIITLIIIKKMDNNIIYKDKKNCNSIIEAIKKDWIDNLHILADFDWTMTKVFFNWERINNLISILGSSEKFLGNAYAIENSKLFEIYYPIEIDPNIDIETK
jgi:hypothetical protein